MAVKKINKSLVVTPNARSSVSVTTTELQLDLFHFLSLGQRQRRRPSAACMQRQEPDLPSLPSPQLVLV